MAPTILNTIPKINMGKRLQQKEDVALGARLLLLPSLSSLEHERRREFFISCSLPMNCSKDKGASDGNNYTSPNEAMIVTSFLVGPLRLKGISAGL
jgi:hypothetical protein